MTIPNDSLEILWRGSDPAKFTALQAALRDESIPFWQTQVYDPPGGFLSSRPYYLEATPGFEIRVHAADLERANGALDWVESKESDANISSSATVYRRASTTISDPRQSRCPALECRRSNRRRLWSGEEDSMAEVPGQRPARKRHPQQNSG